MRLLLILNLIFTMLVLPAFSQDVSEGSDEVARLEIAARSDQESYRAVPCGSAGVLVFFKSVEVADAQRVRWYFSMYDASLKQLWVKSLPVLTDLDFRFRVLSHDTLFLVFVYNGKQKSLDQPLEIVRIVLKTAAFIPNITKVPANSEPAFFSIMGRNAYLALNHKTGQAAVEILDLASNHSKGFLVDQMLPSAFRWFETDSSRSYLKAIVTKAISKKEVEHWYQVFDTSGNVKISTRITAINQDREFTGFRALDNGSGDVLLTGTYRLMAGASSPKNKDLAESSGVFTSLLVPGSQKTLNFFNFLELKNINLLMSARDLVDVKKKALKKNKNIAEFSADLTVLQHDPVLHDGNIIQVSEVFFPQYHTENFTDFDFYGRPYTNSYSIFDGYRFTGAIVTAHSPEGNLLWDNALEMKDVVSAELSPKAVVRFIGDKILLAYCTNGKIGSKIIRQGETTGKLEFSTLESKYPDDKLVSESRSGLLPWYDDYFLCYGFQEIRNIALENNNKRFVFYLTKVKFEE